MTLQENVEDLFEKLNKASHDALDYRGEITTNAKGEASFKVRAFSNVPAEIVVATKEILEGFEKLCREKNIKIAGS